MPLIINNNQWIEREVHTEALQCKMEGFWTEAKSTDMLMCSRTREEVTLTIPEYSIKPGLNLLTDSGWFTAILNESGPMYNMVK